MLLQTKDVLVVVACPLGGGRVFRFSFHGGRRDAQWDGVHCTPAWGDRLAGGLAWLIWLFGAALISSVLIN